MRTWRWPMLVIIAVLLVTALASETPPSERTQDTTDVAAIAPVPTAARPGSLGSTWYCAAGTATGTAQGEAEQFLHMANASSATVHGQLTVYPSDAAPATSAIE